MHFTLILPLFVSSFFWFFVSGFVSGPASAADVAPPAQAPGISSGTQFLTGVEAFQKKKFDVAAEVFTALTKTEGDTPLLLFDLGLVKSQTGKAGSALGLWRKALATDPFYRPAQNAIAWTQPKLEHPEISHEIETWETLRNSALVPMSLEVFVLASAASLLMGGWLLFRYLGQRRNARLDEKPMPGVPFAAGIFGFLFVVCGLLSVAKSLDLQTLRGTILDKKIEARSSPDANSTSLFELYEGLEVVVRRTEKIGDVAWIQVNYPGAATGWVPKSSVFTYDDAAAEAP